MPPATTAVARIAKAIHPQGVSVVWVASLFFEATAAPAAAAAATVAAGAPVVVVVPTTTVPVVVVTCAVTVWVVVTVTWVGGRTVSVTVDGGWVTVVGGWVTVDGGWVTVTVVVLIGGVGAASVVAGGSVVVAGVVVVVREGSVGADTVGAVRVPAAAWFPPPQEVRRKALATPRIAAATNVSAFAALAMRAMLRIEGGVRPHPRGMSRARVG
jgi:hypothetical protein